MRMDCDAPQVLGAAAIYAVGKTDCEPGMYIHIQEVAMAAWYVKNKGNDARVAWIRPPVSSAWASMFANRHHGRLVGRGAWAPGGRSKRT